MIKPVQSQNSGRRSSQDSPIRVRVLRTTDELQSIREHWLRWQQHPNCDHQFFQTVVDTLKSVIRPHVLVAYRGAEPVSILTGRLDRSSVDLSIGYKRLIGLPALSLTFLHEGCVGDVSQEVAKELAHSVLESLEVGEAEFVYFNHLRTGGELYRTVRTLEESHTRRSIGTPRNHRGMNLYVTSAEFMSHLGTKERNNQKRRLRRLEDDFGGNVQIGSYPTDLDLDTLIRDADRVAGKTYQRALGVGFEDTPQIRDRMETEAQQGWLRGFVLYLDQAPVAFWLGISYGQTFYSGFTGYDPAYSKYSPGMYLLLKAIEELCQQNSGGALKRADFGLGDAEWKQVIGDLEWEDVPVWIFPRTTKGAVLALIRTTSEFLNRRAEKLLGDLQLVSKLKKAWRRALRRS